MEEVVLKSFFTYKQILISYLWENSPFDANKLGTELDNCGFFERHVLIDDSRHNKPPAKNSANIPKPYSI